MARLTGIATAEMFDGTAEWIVRCVVAFNYYRPFLTENVGCANSCSDAPLTFIFSVLSCMLQCSLDSV